MSKPWIFISPASRGIGHALARHLLQRTRTPIIGTARQDLAGVKASILQDLEPHGLNASHHDYERRLHVLQLDVTNEGSIAAATKATEELFPGMTHHLHLGFALPGVLRPERSPAAIEYVDALHTLRVNLLGPLMLMKHFGEFLPRRVGELDLRSVGAEEGDGGDSSETPLLSLPEHATFVAAAARVGSTSDNRLGGWYSYRASKAGVISVARTYDIHLRARSGGRAIALAYHPGTVRTGLSREFWNHVPPDQLFSPDRAARYLADLVCRRLGPGHRGRCWDWKGEEVLP